VKSVLVTGAGGFIGSSVVERLSRRGDLVRAIHRQPACRIMANQANVEYFFGVDLLGNFDLRSALKGVDCVVHCAAIAHRDRSQKHASRGDVFSVNVEMAKRLAEQALAAGARRFLFISSIGVLGWSTKARGPFTERDAVNPGDDYARSKLECEEALASMVRSVDGQLCILRLPLVYGRGAAGKFSQMRDLVRSGVPLPVGAFREKRSLLGIENLLDLVEKIVDSSGSVDGVFLVADDPGRSIREMVELLAKCQGRRDPCVEVPKWMLRIGAGLVFKREEFDRLEAPLVVDSSLVRGRFGWRSRISFEDGLREAAC
jgi:nucleoside-diphosphate-sugar epimerase